MVRTRQSHPGPLVLLGCLSLAACTTPLGERVVSYKIWKRGGRVVQASDPELVGRTFKPSPGLKAAWDGHVTAGLNRITSYNVCYTKLLRRCRLEEPGQFGTDGRREALDEGGFFLVAGQKHQGGILIYSLSCVTGG